MKTIIVATDFSRAATNAALYAARMAVCRYKELHLLHVYTLPVTFADVPLPLTLQELETDVTKQMQALRDYLTLETDGKVNITTSVTAGNFYEELEKECERIQPFVVVMGSQGTSAAERFLFGSHTVFAMKNLQWPLITVPPQAHYSNIVRIALACDMDHVVDTTPVEAIADWVLSFNAQLLVINIGRKDTSQPGVKSEAGILTEMLQPLHPTFHFLTSKNTDQELAGFVQLNNVQMLIVLPEKHDLTGRIFHPGYTRKLVLRSDVPVMALHA